ncbi:MAG: hypothetical protein ACOX0D_00190 [Sphaerochaeta sp.]
MISEKIFIRNYWGFWDSLFPLHRAFLKGVVMECAQEQHEIKLTTSGRRFSFVSEIGFQIFSIAITKQVSIDSIGFGSTLYNDIQRRCIQQFELFQDDDSTICEPLSKPEFSDAISISHVLKNRFKGQELTISPKFRGCGIIDTCYGDILVADTLFEIKAVNRNFHVVDFRQLITYCCLNHISKAYAINSIGLFNPKRGMCYTIPLDLFSSAIAGIDINDLYWEIINFISQEETSK